MPSPVIALFKSSHPGPSLAVTALALILGFGIGLPASTFVLLGCAVFTGQLSVGFSNDWIDASRDTATRRSDKPIAQGWILARTVRNAALLSLGIAILVSFALGMWAGIAHTIAIALAWAYNAGLKNTALSVVPFAVSFALLATVPGLSLPEPQATAWWVVFAAALLGGAAHFANVLPDLADDAVTGVRGLPHRLGARVSGVTAFIALLAATIIISVGTGLPLGPLQWIGLLTAAAMSVIGTRLVLTREPTRLLFQLIIAVSIINLILLATAGTGVLD